MIRLRTLLLQGFLLAAIPGYSQLKVDSLGNTHAEKSLYLSEGADKGLLMGQLKLYTHNDDVYFLKGENGGFKLGTFGKMKLKCSYSESLLQDSVGYTFDSPYINVDPWNYDATLFIRSNGSRPLHTSLYSNMLGSPREGIRSDVLLQNDKAFAAYAIMEPYSGLIFSVYGSGLVYASGGFTQTSDGRLKKDVKTLTSASDRLNSLRGVSFRYKDSSKSTRSLSATNEIGDCISEEVKVLIQEEQRRARIGLVAQEVETIVPEVVRTMPDGTKTIMYTDLIPLLIENIKELNKTVEEQNERIEALENKLNPKKVFPGNELTANPLKENYVLYQNSPNPFNQETTISYRIPNNCSAAICIYSLSGQQLKKILLSDTNGKVTIYASELPAGTYAYSLMVDNQTVDSKVMILTK